MENPGIIMINSSFFPVNFWDPKNVVDSTSLLFHEVSHMWLGYQIQIDWWDSIWIKESLAEFVTFEALDYVSKNNKRENIYYSD